MFVCAIKSENTHQGPSCIIAHQMWHDHPFSKRNRTTDRTVGVGVEGDKELGRAGGQNLKKSGVRQYRGIFIK